MPENIYLSLTEAFNAGRIRAILSSGQAVVLHRLAIMSKDGDWIVRESPDDLLYILGVLEDRGARYRFGAPLDVRWMAGGWSAHFEFRTAVLRVRTDFVTRPPRISEEALKRIWKDAVGAGRPAPFVDALDLIELKKTNRERDYAVIGELARLIEDPRRQLLQSRSARDLLNLAERYPRLAARLTDQRPVLRHLREGREALERALDAERRSLIHANEQRLLAYRRTAEAWSQAWPSIAPGLQDKPLTEAHRIILEQAERLLPFEAESP